MTTSNSTNYTQTRNQIIFDALFRLGVVRAGGTVPTNDYTACSTVLNNITKHLQKLGLHVWAENEGTLFLIDGQAKYIIDGSANIAGDDVISTTIASSSSGTNLTLTSTTGISVNDKIGVELDGGTRQWSTVLLVNSSTSVTLNDSLTDTAAVDNTVFVYTTNTGKPISITSAVYRDSSNIDIPVNILGQDEFMEISDKTTEASQINSISIKFGNTSSMISVWPVPDSYQGRLVFMYQRQLQDFDTSSDTPDLPSEWTETLTLLLMVKVGPAYGKRGQDLQDIRNDAERSLMDMKLNDLNNGSIKICPADRDMY